MSIFSRCVVSFLVFYALFCNISIAGNIEKEIRYFGNLCVHEESGDVIGSALLIVPGRSSPAILLYQADGVIPNPYLYLTKVVKDKLIAYDNGLEVIEIVEIDDSVHIKYLDGRIGVDGGPVDILNSRSSKVFSDIDTCN